MGAPAAAGITVAPPAAWLTPRGYSGPRVMYLDYVLEQLGELGPVTSRAMFGGHGLYLGDQFFAIVHRDRLYFKVDEASRSEYERRGSDQFRPNERQALRSYWEVPAEVVEDRGLAVEWARDAVACAAAAKAGAEASPC
jgi:DNA transformation protein